MRLVSSVPSVNQIEIRPMGKRLPLNVKRVARFWDGLIYVSPSTGRLMTNRTRNSYDWVYITNLREGYARELLDALVSVGSITADEAAKALEENRTARMRSEKRLAATNLQRAAETLSLKLTKSQEKQINQVLGIEVTA